MDFQMMMKKTQSFPLSWILILILASRSGKKIYCISQGLSKAPRSASWRQAQDLLRGLFQDSQAPSATPREVPAVGSHHGFSEDVQGYSNPLHVQITAITTIVYLAYIYSNNSNHLLLPISTLQTYLECWAQLWCWSSLFRVGTRRRKDFWLEGLNRDFGWMSWWTLILCIHCVCLNTTNF